MTEEYYPGAVPLPDQRDVDVGGEGARPDPDERRSPGDTMAQSVDPGAYPPERVREENEAMSENVPETTGGNATEDTVLSDAEAAQVARGDVGGLPPDSDESHEQGGAAPAVGP